MKGWLMQVAIHYAHPKDSLHTCQHYRMCRAPQEMHTAHYALEWLLQYQEQFVFVYQEEMQDARVVQRSRCEVSYCPLVNSTSSCVGACLPNYKVLRSELQTKFKLLIYGVPHKRSSPVDQRSSPARATPTEVRASLRYLGNFSWKTSTDPDSIHEPLLDVHRVAALGTFRVVAPTAAYATH